MAKFKIFSLAVAGFVAADFKDTFGIFGAFFKVQKRKMAKAPFLKLKSQDYPYRMSNQHEAFTRHGSTKTN